MRQEAIVFIRIFVYSDLNKDVQRGNFSLNISVGIVGFLYKCHYRYTETIVNYRYLILILQRHQQRYFGTLSLT